MLVMLWIQVCYLLKKYLHCSGLFSIWKLRRVLSDNFFQNFCLLFSWIPVFLHWEKMFLIVLWLVAHLELIFLNIGPEKWSSGCLYGLTFKTTNHHLSFHTEEGLPNLWLTKPDYPNTYHTFESLKTVILMKCWQGYFMWVIVVLLYLLTSKLHWQQL